MTTVEELRQRRSNLSTSQRDALEKRLRRRDGQTGTIRRRAAGVPALASFAQQRLWFLELFEPGSATYHIPLALRLRGVLDVDALQRSLCGLIARHESLRTTFVLREQQLFQQIQEDASPAFQVIDLSYLGEAERAQTQAGLLERAGNTAFDLEHGPLLRMRVVICGEREYLLLLTIHHIVFDGWSMGVMLRELTARYTAEVEGTQAQLGELAIQYADYANWQREWLQGERLEEHLAYWKGQLAGAPAFLDLPTDYVRPARQTSAGKRLRFQWSQEVSTALRRFSQEEGVTLFMTLLGAWQVVLGRSSGQEEVVVGIPIATRTQREELKDIIGLLVNTLAVRTAIGGNATFREVVQRVRKAALGAYAHQELPFEQVVEAVQPPRDGGRSPLFQAMFAFEPGERQMALADLEVEAIETALGIAKFELSLTIQEEASGGLSGELEYNTDLFTEASMQRLVEHLEVMVRDALARPDCPAEHLELLTPIEREMVLADGNQSERPGERRHLVSLLQERAEISADVIALVEGDEQWSYACLHQSAQRVARRLQAAGVGPEVVVGLYLERSSAQMIGMLAILQSGGAYLPLDVKLPQERVWTMLEDASVNLVVSNRKWGSRLGAYGGQVLYVEEEQEEQVPVPALERVELAHQLVYVIYTSGSTGRPKGVQIEQEGLVNLLYAMEKLYGVGIGDRVAQFASLSFDAAAEEIYPTWLMGATLVLRPDDQVLLLAAWEEWIALQGISLMELPTAYWHHWVTSRGQDPAAKALPTTLRMVIVGGEQARCDSYQQWWREGGSTVRWSNTYGPTEATVTAVAYDPLPETLAEHVEAGRLPIGRALAGTQAYVLDRQMQPVPLGVVGELYIGGAGVARGYIGRAEATAEQFVPDPYGQEPGARLYRTGDLVKRSADGYLEYYGRRDTQVKIRGYRIEVEEIRAVLQQQVGVEDCLVVARAKEGEEKRLMAYVQGKNLPEWSVLKQGLQGILPGYMVPATFVEVESWPLTTSGKLDLRALPAPDEQGDAQAHIVAPRNALEERLLEIWQNVLGRASISIDDNFFELGGHSLLAVTLVDRMNSEFKRSIPLAALFENATIQALAEMLHEPEQSGSEISSALVPIQTRGTKPALIFLHPVGGEVLCYRDLARLLDVDQPFYGLRFPFQVDMEHPPLRMEDLVAHYISVLQTALPDGPYILGGWSLGGTIAYAVAHQLRLQGVEVPALVLIDSYAPATFPAESDDLALLLEMVTDLVYTEGESLSDAINDPEMVENIYDILKPLSREERLQYILKSGRELQLFPTDLGLYQMQQLFFTFKTNTVAVQNYTPPQSDQPMLLFTSEDRRDGLEDEEYNGWVSLNHTLPERYTLPGNHYTLLKQPGIEILVARLKIFLERYWDASL